MRLLILGMLIEKPMHGYDLKKIIEERTGDFTDYKFGSVYFALKKLTEEGFTQLVESDDNGNRPKKKIYQITKQGKEEFIRLLNLRFSENKRTYYPLDEAIFFSKHLEKDKLLKYIEMHLAYTENAINYLEKHIIEHENVEMNRYNAALIIDHTLEHIKAEKTWLLKAKVYFLEGEENNA